MENRNEKHAQELLTFGEASAIMNRNESKIEMIAEAFNLGYERGLGANRNELVVDYSVKINELVANCNDVALLDLIYKLLIKSQKEA